MATTLDLQGDALAMYRGDDYIMVLNLKDSDGDPLPLAGYSFKSQIREERIRRPGEEVDDPLAEFDINVNTPSASHITLHLDKDDTYLLTSSCYWDMQATDPDGNVETWFSGEVEVRGDVTR